MNCILCNFEILPDPNGWDGGHNPEPLAEGRCCGDCNDTKVIPARLKNAGYPPEQASELAQILAEAPLDSRNTERNRLIFHKEITEYGDKIT